MVLWLVGFSAVAAAVGERRNEDCFYRTETVLSKKTAKNRIV